MSKQQIKEYITSMGPVVSKATGDDLEYMVDKAKAIGRAVGSAAHQAATHVYHSNDMSLGTDHTFINGVPPRARPSLGHKVKELIIGLRGPRDRRNAGGLIDIPHPGQEDQVEPETQPATHRLMPMIIHRARQVGAAVVSHLNARASRLDREWELYHAHVKNGESPRTAELLASAGTPVAAKPLPTSRPVERTYTHGIHGINIPLRSDEAGYVQSALRNRPGAAQQITGIIQKGQELFDQDAVQHEAEKAQKRDAAKIARKILAQKPHLKRASRDQILSAIMDHLAQNS